MLSMLVQNVHMARRQVHVAFTRQCVYDFCFRRYRHQLAHRTISVQLLSDVQGLGKLGSIQSVAPGLMRSVLYPQGKAVYLLKDVPPQLPPLVDHENAVSTATPSKEGVVDFANLKSRLEALTPIVFHRRVRTAFRNGLALPSSAKGQPVYGSVTLHDLARRLSENHNLSLVPPDALLSLQKEGLKDKLKFTGMFTVLVQLRTGEVIPLRVLVEPEVDSKEQGKQQNQGGILLESNSRTVETRASHVLQAT